MKKIEKVASPNGNITIWAVRSRQPSDYNKYVKMLLRTRQLQNRAEQAFKESLDALTKGENK